MKNLRLFLTLEHHCSYLAGRMACNLVVDPEAVNQPVYSYLARQGYRRSGDHIYRPHCGSCTECRSLRIPVEDFQTSRSQQRTWRKNQDLTLNIRPAEYVEQHYRLFERYLHNRHRDGGMDDTSPEHYLTFITSSWSDTWLYEFHRGEELLAVAVVDHLLDGLSAVYTFFDPEQSRRGLGVYVILKQIEQARQRSLDWVYLGYWVRECDKMTYKSAFKPHQLFIAGRWQTVDD